MEITKNTNYNLLFSKIFETRHIHFHRQRKSQGKVVEGEVVGRYKRSGNKNHRLKKHFNLLLYIDHSMKAIIKKQLCVNIMDKPPFFLCIVAVVVAVWLLSVLKVSHVTPCMFSSIIHIHSPPHIVPETTTSTTTKSQREHNLTAIVVTHE